MINVNDIFAYLCQLAPLELQMDFDNSGFLLGRGSAPVSKTLLALDVTDAVVSQAVALGAELIVSHHPLIFTGVKRLTDAEPDTARLLTLAESRVAVISMHTNLDIAAGGVNDVLLRRLGLESLGCFEPEGCGRVAELKEPLPMSAFLPACKAVLDTACLRYYDSGRPVRRLAVMGGSGGGSLRAAYDAGCDSYLSADIKYHQFLEARDLGMNLIDGDHYGTENPVIPDLAGKLAARFGSVEFIVAQSHSQPIAFI